MLLDFYRKGMPPDLADKLVQAGGLLPLLATIVPGPTNAGRAQEDGQNLDAHDGP